MRVLNLVTVPVSFIYQKITQHRTNFLSVIGAYYLISIAYSYFSVNAAINTPSNQLQNQDTLLPSNSTSLWSQFNATAILFNPPSYIGIINSLKSFCLNLFGGIAFIALSAVSISSFLWAKSKPVIIKLAYHCGVIDLASLEIKVRQGSIEDMYRLSIIEPDSLFRIFFDSCMNESNYDLVKKLLDYVKDVNQLNNEGNTALHATILHSINSRIMGLLLKKEGINADIVNIDGDTALHLIVKLKKVTQLYI